MKPLRFSWDDQKAGANLTKHGVSFEEATSVFDDARALIRHDPDHSLGEHREIIVGISDSRRLLFVSFTERRDVLRIISAREATKRERKHYEEIR